jgi:hypothetical protein
VTVGSGSNTIDFSIRPAGSVDETQ